MSGKRRIRSKKVERNKKNVHVAQNIFEELGLDQPEEWLVRSRLLSEVALLIRKSELSQKDVGERLGIAQSKVSKLVNGRLSEFSTDALLNYLSILGCDVQISIKKPRSRAAVFGKRGKVGVL